MGWGFRPFRTGGLIAYVEDVTAAQAARGHEVSYFFAGRHLPGEARPHLRRWQRDGVDMHELFNGPVLPGVDAGSRYPDRDLDEPVSEAAFGAVLDRVRPDVVHVQELTGLPTSLLALPRERGIPVVLSLEDYHLLCPTVKLYDAEGRNCRRQRPGEMCTVCCRDAPVNAAPWVRRTLEQVVLRSERGTMAANNVINAVRYRPRVGRALARLRPGPAAPEPAAPRRAAPPPAYDRRREVNVARMSEVDVVLAMSHRVAEIYAELGVDERRLRVLHFTVSHLAGIVPAPRADPQDPMVFTLLNACSSVAKGVNVVIEALDALERRGLGDRFRLHVWGYVAPPMRPALVAHRAVEVRGNYTGEDLSPALADADVGIVPSIWEEAYGYTGVEMLAGGLPVIGSARGGITDYVLPGETGWRNESATGEELAALMARLIEQPAEVTALRRGLRERPPAAVKTMDRHLDELDAVYAELRT